MTCRSVLRDSQNQCETLRLKKKLIAFIFRIGKTQGYTGILKNTYFCENVGCPRLFLAQTSVGEMSEQTNILLLTSVACIA